MLKVSIDDGILISLEHIRIHDNPTLAQDIVEASTTVASLEKCARRTGNETDLNTIEWLKNNSIK
jgi:hypothetical protein